jgi:hypothetical protein
MEACSSGERLSYEDAVAEMRRPIARSELDNSGRLRDLVRQATLAASSHNTQPWKFALAERSITTLPDFTRRTPIVDPDDHHLFVSLGCATENLVHAGHTSGLHADVSVHEDSIEVASTTRHRSSRRSSRRFRPGNLVDRSTTAARCPRRNSAYWKTWRRATEFMRIDHVSDGLVVAVHDVGRPRVGRDGRPVTRLTGAL